MELRSKLLTMLLAGLLALGGVACSAEGNVGDGGADLEIEGEGDGGGEGGDG